MFFFLQNFHFYMSNSTRSSGLVTFSQHVNMLKIFSKLVFPLFSILFSFLRLIYWYGEALFRALFVPPPRISLDGETILVTGAAGGIGSALCRYLVRSSNNLKLVMWGTNRKGMEELAEELEQKGGARCFIYVVDISSKEDIQRVASLVKNEIAIGPISIIINNAGVLPFGKFLELTDQEIEQSLRINLSAQIWILREFLGPMMSSNHGRIVNICSTAGLSAGPCCLSYIASKFGVTGYSEALKVELEYFGYDGIRVTTAFPCLTRTPLIKSLDMVWPKIMEPEYVARLVVDGMRRGSEFVYAPPLVAMLPYAESLVPMKQRRLWRNMAFNAVVPKDPSETKIFREGHRRASERESRM